MNESVDDPDDEPTDEPDQTADIMGEITCWCGATGTYSELFDDSCLDKGCGGTGSLNCYCGGDQCVCHFHGEAECDGCEDCDFGDDNDDDYDDRDYDEDFNDG